MHFNGVTEHPAAQWTAQQIMETFPFDTAPRYLLFDNASKVWVSRMWSQHLEVLGSFREIVLTMSSFNERHLRRVLRDYLKYYHTSRTHLSLNKDPPKRRPSELPDASKIVSYHRSVAYITDIFESRHESGVFCKWLIYKRFYLLKAQVKSVY